MMEPEGRRSLPINPILPVAGIGVLVLIVLLFAVVCSGGDSDVEPDPTPTPEVTPTVVAGVGQAAALARYVQNNLGAEYAGECAAATVEEDVGKYCTNKLGEREGVHAYVLGLTFSEFSELVMLQERAGAWQIVETLPITPTNAAIPGIPWPLVVGAEVVVTGTGDCLNVRTEPAIQVANVADCIGDGTVISLAEGPVESNDLLWWRVDGRDGWVAADYLRYPDSAADAPPPTPTP